MGHTSVACPSFETRPAAAPQDEVGLDRLSLAIETLQAILAGGTMEAGVRAGRSQSPTLGDVEFEPDRPMVGRPEGKRGGGAAGEAVHQAAVEAERHDVAGEMRRLAWADITEARQQDRPHHVVVADDRRGLAAQRSGDARELAAVQELAVREMDVGE